MTFHPASPALYIPDESYPPGEALRERLTELGMSQADLAIRSGLSTKHINQIVQGIAPITHDTALVFERVTGTPARIWNALEAAYRDAEVRSRDSHPSADDLLWIKTIPVNDLRKRGILTATKEPLKIRQQLLAFFGVADRPAWERLWLDPEAAFRRSKVFQSQPGPVAAWLRLGELSARKLDCKPFDPKAFRELLASVRHLTREPNPSATLVEHCAGVGVALVFVPEIPKSRTSGAARWLSPSKAMLILSDRHKREDSFWFTFFHEAAHLLLHSKREIFVNSGDRDRQGELVEAEADRFAADTLIPPDAASRLPLIATQKDARDFAEQVGIAPGIVVGRLHNDGVWGWNVGSELIRKVRIVEIPDAHAGEAN